MAIKGEKDCEVERMTRRLLKAAVEESGTGLSLHFAQAARIMPVAAARFD